MFNTCQMQYKLAYVDNLRQTSGNIHTVFGTSLHEVIQGFLSTMYGSNTKEALSMPLEETLRDRLRENFKSENEKLTEGYVCTKDELVEFYEDGIAILKWFRRHFEKLYSRSSEDLIGIELELAKPIRDNLSFIGFIDVAVRDNYATRIKLIDIKTSTRGWSDYQKKDKVKNAQLVLYKHMYSELFDTALDSIDVEYHITRRKIPDYTPYPIPRFTRHVPSNGKISVNNAKQSFDAFIDHVFDDVGNYKTDARYLKNPFKNGFNCKYCEFMKRGICDGKV